MGIPDSKQPLMEIMDKVLGYLNFSSGNHDPAFLVNLDALFRDVRDTRENRPTEESSSVQPIWVGVRERLLSRLGELTESNPTFKDSAQANVILETIFDHFLPVYRKFHRDLLFHQSDDLIFNSFFVGRAFEMGLQVDASLDQPEQVVAECLNQINDFLGHRPVATLEGARIEPYDNEWIRPIPVFIQEAGAATGPYCTLIEKTIEILKSTDPHLLRAAHFEPARMAELAIDPRAFDFDHPINQRPNHHFGQWDEHSIGDDGYFHRFVVHQVTLDSLLERVEDSKQDTKLPDSEALYEAAAVLAGTMLMASGISGGGPGTYDSNTTLASLLPVIAGYRDQFYNDLMRVIPESHRNRLLEEAKTKHQPFGGVRQDLNARLAQRRATQLVNCRLASIFARMGYPDAAEEQSKVVPVASARINCQIDCLLSSADQAIKNNELQEAFDSVPRVMDRLKRGIHCGAIVDPWNILGFDANYSLFPAVENTVKDHRVYDLIDQVERLFGLCSLLWSEAAASDQHEMCSAIQKQFSDTVDWWRQYAAHEVMSVDAVDADEIYQAAELVAQALNLWHQGGAEAGDIEFWRNHAELFDTPKAYALVIDALMQRQDYRTSMALMVHWISQSEYILLQQGDSSIHDLIFRWILEQKKILREQNESTDEAAEKVSPEVVWERIRKFYDFIEANAEGYWNVPDFEVNRKSLAIRPEILDDFDSEEAPEDGGDDEDDLYRHAYDDVIYTDTTDDGVEGEIFDTSQSSDDALEAEVERVVDRLEFLRTIAGYWGVAATIPLPVNRASDVDDDIQSRLVKRKDIIEAWVKQAIDNRARLFDLIESIASYRLPKSGTGHEAMVHYDQQRIYKDTLLDQTIMTCIETENGIRHLIAVVQAIDHLLCQDDSDSKDAQADEPLTRYVNGGAAVTTVYSALLLEDAPLVREHFEDLKSYLADQPLLYVPLSRGGNPIEIVRARVVQTAILDLLRRLPRLGLFHETYELTNTTLAIERNNPVGRGAVTEFDEIFEIAYISMVRTLIRSTNQLRGQLEQDPEKSASDVKNESQDVLFDCVEMLTESMLMLWLDHSRTLRLSVIEKVLDRKSWETLVEFIKNYGKGLFTQHFLNVRNIRGILHQGVDHWLTQIEQADDRPDLRLFDELGVVLERPKAVRYLTLVLESVIENYNEYRDYNTTTTQSDHGESLYMLLDFLRLRSRYDRVCWNLKPVVWAHRILVSQQENNVARMWRRSLVDKIGPEADKYLGQLEKLRQNYSIRMASVGRRIEGRFGHQMQIDRLKALVGPAMENPLVRKSYRTFELLRHEAQAFSRSTMGVGIDLPAWLAALEHEVEQHLLPQRLRDETHQNINIEPASIPIALLREQLEDFPKRNG